MTVEAFNVNTSTASQQRGQFIVGSKVTSTPSRLLSDRIYARMLAREYRADQRPWPRRGISAYINDLVDAAALLIVLDQFTFHSSYLIG